MRTLGIAKVFVLLRELQPLFLANLLLSHSHTPERQTSMPVCSRQAIKSPYICHEPLLSVLRLVLEVEELTTR